MDTIARAHAHTPTHKEVCDFALALALDEGVEDRAKLDLLHWPENAPPPAGELYTYEWAMEFREKARIALTERMNPEGEMEILYDCLDPRFAVKRKRKKSRYPPAPTPTWEATVEFARVLAIDAGEVNRHLLRLIGWTTGQRLKMPGKTFGKYLPRAMACFDRAWTLLAERMKLDHRWRLRRLHREKLRKRQKAYRWTRHPQRKPVTRPFFLRKERARPRPLQSARASRAQDPPCLPLPVETEILLFSPGGGHRPGALRQRSLRNPLPQCAA